MLSRETYVKLISIPWSRLLGIFSPPVCTAKNAQNPEKYVSDSRALVEMKKLMNLLGYDAKLYGEHSSKRGGATAAAANGATEKQLKRLGVWRPDAMPAKYVDFSIPSRISMSELLQNLLIGINSVWIKNNITLYTFYRQTNWFL